MVHAHRRDAEHCALGRSIAGQWYLRYTTALGNIFAPMAGVLPADYLVIRRGRIDVHALFARNGAYWYVGRFNPAAFLSVFLGLCLCTLFLAHGCLR